MNVKKEEKEETALETVVRVIDVDLPKIIAIVVDDKKLSLQQKTRVISVIDSALSHLRIIRAQLET